MDYHGPHAPTDECPDCLTLFGNEPPPLYQVSVRARIYELFETVEHCEGYAAFRPKPQYRARRARWSRPTDKPMRYHFAGGDVRWSPTAAL